MPNYGRTNPNGKGTHSGGLVEIGTQVAEITKPLASVDEAMDSGTMVVMHNSKGIAKRLDMETERRIRDLAKDEEGSK